MRFLNFTPQEIRALLFLLVALLIGSGITIYKKQHPRFAPELVFREPPLSSLENQSQFNEAHREAELNLTDTSQELSKSLVNSPISNPTDENRSQDPEIGISTKAPGPLKGKIDLNSASASELELLPQIGPALSQRIIDYRKTKGKFQKIEDLMKVPGIGPKTFEKIKDFLTVK
jgi:comEA protein